MKDVENMKSSLINLQIQKKKSNLFDVSIKNDLKTNF